MQKSKTEKINKSLNKYIAVLDYTDKILLDLPIAGSISLFSFIAVIVRPVQIASASISLFFLIIDGINKMFLKTMEYKKHRKSA